MHPPATYCQKEKQTEEAATQHGGLLRACVCVLVYSTVQQVGVKFSAAIITTDLFSSCMLTHEGPTHRSRANGCLDFKGSQKD